MPEQRNRLRINRFRGRITALRKALKIHAFNRLATELYARTGFEISGATLANYDRGLSEPSASRAEALETAINKVLEQ
jgi:hypothetical protein